MSKYANLRIFWRLGTYFQNNSFVSSHIDLFWLPGFTEEKKNDCPVSNPYLLICRKRLTQICQMFFWRHVGTYCPNMAISDFFLFIFPKKIICIIRTPICLLSPLCTEKINNDYPVPGWFSETKSVDVPQKYLAKISLYFWRHVGTYCPNMANSETFFPIIWRFGVIKEK